MAGNADLVSMSEYDDTGCVVKVIFLSICIGENHGVKHDKTQLNNPDFCAILRE